MTTRGFLLAALTAAPLLPAAAPVQAGSEPVAARALGKQAVVTLEEYDLLVMNRHAGSEQGREALQRLLKNAVLDQLARESKLEVTTADIDRRMNQLDAEIRAHGDPAGLEGQIRTFGVDRETFREFMRLQIVQEVLSRRALGIPEGREVPGDQQEMWLAQQLEQRGTDYPRPPYEQADPVLARCGAVEVRQSEFLPHLRDQLDPETVRDDCYQLLLEELLRARMPDLAPEALAAEIGRELDRRRAELASDPQYQGLTFEQVMAARGLRLDRIDRDPAIVVAALARLWVDRTHGEEGLRAAFEAERGWFEDHFGPSVPIAVIFKNAVASENPLQHTTFEQAEAQLADVARAINGEEAFAVAAMQHSEDKGTRERGGALGSTTRANERFPAQLRELAFEHPGAGLVGPVRLTQGISGVALLWIGELQPAPGWEEMRAHVHNELRKRLLEETLQPSEVVTWLDAG